jgi:hypothetical protein
MESPNKGRLPREKVSDSEKRLMPLLGPPDMMDRSIIQEVDATQALCFFQNECSSSIGLGGACGFVDPCPCPV